MAVLQVLELLPEHGAGRSFVAVKQRVGRGWIRIQHVLDLTQDGRDSGTCRNAEVVESLTRAEREPPLGLHDVHDVSRGEVAVGIGGELASRHFFDAHAPRAFMGSRAQRVTSSDLLPFNVCAQREVLT